LICHVHHVLTATPSFQQDSDYSGDYYLNRVGDSWKASEAPNSAYVISHDDQVGLEAMWPVLGPYAEPTKFALVISTVTTPDPRSLVDDDYDTVPFKIRVLGAYPRGSDFHYVPEHGGPSPYAQPYQYAAFVQYQKWGVDEQHEDTVTLVPAFKSGAAGAHDDDNKALEPPLLAYRKSHARLHDGFALLSAMNLDSKLFLPRSHRRPQEAFVSLKQISVRVGGATSFLKECIVRSLPRLPPEQRVNYHDMNLSSFTANIVRQISASFHSTDSTWEENERCVRGMGLLNILNHHVALPFMVSIQPGMVSLACWCPF